MFFSCSLNKYKEIPWYCVVFTELFNIEIVIQLNLFGLLHTISSFTARFCTGSVNEKAANELGFSVVFGIVRSIR